MINIYDNMNLEDYGLLLQEDKLVINKNIDEVILIEKPLEVIISNNVDVMIIDNVCGGCVNVNVGIGANVNYQMLHSYNCQHNFKCSGNLRVMQISINSTDDIFNVELVSESADVFVELLTFGNNSNNKFVQNIIHLNKNTSSNISNFGIAMNGANIVFDTTGKIHKGMSKSVCRQLSKGVVMDDDSSVTSKPILLIDEYDVVANHGASIGKMSDESLFYLMSRGLNKTEAFLLILDGIIKPFIDQINDEKIKISIEEEIKALIKR